MQNSRLTVPNDRATSAGGTAGTRPRSRSTTSQGRGSPAPLAPSTPLSPLPTSPPSTPSTSSGVFPAIRPDFSRQPSISISIRRPSQTNLQANSQQYNGSSAQAGSTGVRRSRSLSAPQRFFMSTPAQEEPSHLEGIGEETVSPTTGHATASASIPAALTFDDPAQSDAQSTGKKSRRLRRARTNIAAGDHANTFEDNLVDYLDVVDPEVSMLSTLTNVQNSLFVPDLGRFVNRRPTYTFTPTTRLDEEESISSTDAEEKGKQKRPDLDMMRTQTGATLNTLTSNISDRYYAVLPHGVRLSGWTEEEKLELNDYVRHSLHSRRSRFRRSMRGFSKYVSKPLGFFVTLYAVLITLFGLAWVLFLIGWINVGGSRQNYIINIIDNVLVALFAIVGDGLAPFRIIDTYHMCFIAHYHHLTWRLRREQALPQLEDHNDLPAIQPAEIDDHHELEKEPEFSVLNAEQQKKLVHHQKKFSRSHSFYKPHETTTHHAFPLRLLVAIVVLLDCHSILQIALGACTWSISYHVRPFALTTVILCCSITVNITAGVLISVGDHRTRKKDVLEKMDRQQLTEEAMRKVEKRKRGGKKPKNGAEGVLQHEPKDDITPVGTT